MSSIHIWKGIEVAAGKGAYAGSPDMMPLWEMSKRELVEIALRLGEMCADDFSPEGAFKRVMEERDILRANGII